MIGDFGEWLFENSQQVKSIKMIVLYCLENLMPDGGNTNLGNSNLPEEGWKRYGNEFSDTQGPDTWLNMGTEGIRDIVISLNSKVDKEWGENVLEEANLVARDYGLVFSLIEEDEIVVEIIKVDTPQDVVNFYRERSKHIEELQKELHITLKSRKIGI